MINSLLEHVRLSVCEPPAPEGLGGSAVVGMVTAEEQQLYQDSLVHALAEYTHHLPDFHKIEAMLFILTKARKREFFFFDWVFSRKIQTLANTKLQNLKQGK